MEDHEAEARTPEDAYDLGFEAGREAVVEYCPGLNPFPRTGLGHELRRLWKLGFMAGRVDGKTRAGTGRIEVTPV